MRISDFNGQVVWITGASSGLGRHMAYEFARYGAKLALSARRTAHLEMVLEEVIALGGEGLVVPCDVQEEAAIEEAVRLIVQHYGHLDVAVANAGFGVSGRVDKLTAAE